LPKFLLILRGFGLKEFSRAATALNLAQRLLKRLGCRMAGCAPESMGFDGKLAVGSMVTSMVFFMLDSNGEFDIVANLFALDRPTLFAGFCRRLVDPVKLREFAVVGPNLGLNMARKEIRGEAKVPSGLPIGGNVIRSFETDDVLAFGRLGVVAAGLGVGNEVRDRVRSMPPARPRCRGFGF
jgi:hypothetical protein